MTLMEMWDCPFHGLIPESCTTEDVGVLQEDGSMQPAKLRACNVHVSYDDTCMTTCDGPFNYDLVHMGDRVA